MINMMPRENIRENMLNYNFKFSNYLCIYGYARVPEEIKELGIKEKYEILQKTLEENKIEYICFHYLLSNTKRSRNTPLVFIELWKHKSGKNFTWMSKEQLEEHVGALRTDLNIDVDFYILEKSDRFRIIFEYTDRMTRREFKFTCFWIRHAFQFPESTLLLDAYRLKELPEYKDESIFNLFLIPTRYIVNGNGWNSGRSMYIPYDQKISTLGKFVNTEVLKRKLKRTDTSLVMSLYPSIPKSKKSPVFDEEPGTFRPWLSDKSFYEKRLPVYREIYQLLKDNEEV